MTPEQIMDCLIWLFQNASTARVFVQCFGKDVEWIERFIRREIDAEYQREKENEHGTFPTNR